MTALSGTPEGVCKGNARGDTLITTVKVAFAGGRRVLWRDGEISGRPTILDAFDAEAAFMKEIGGTLFGSSPNGPTYDLVEWRTDARTFYALAVYGLRDYGEPTVECDRHAGRRVERASRGAARVRAQRAFAAEVDPALSRK